MINDANHLQEGKKFHAILIVNQGRPRENIVLTNCLLGVMKRESAVTRNPFPFAPIGATIKLALWPIPKGVKYWPAGDWGFPAIRNHASNLTASAAWPTHVRMNPCALDSASRPSSTVIST